MTNIAIAHTMAAAIAGFVVHHALCPRFVARFDACERERAFIRIERFTGIRILLGSVLRYSITRRESRSWESKAGARGVSDK